MRRILISTLFSFFLVLTCIILCHRVAVSSYRSMEDIIVSESRRIKAVDVTNVEVAITETTTLDDIADVLYTNGIITDKHFFLLETKLDGQQSPFIPGQYTISSNMSVAQILTLLTTSLKDERNTVKFTIPEGYSVEQIAETLAAKNIVTKEAFLEAVTQRNYALEYSFLADIPDNDSYRYKLEGYLFPDTYVVRKNCSAEEIVIKMLDRFDEIYSRYASYAYNAGYTTHQLLTIASIIEQEARLEEERATISGVIYNRLDSGMRLQMCSTVQYSLNKRKSSLTYADLEKESPYNTYLYEGLPTGPICNPGEACIKAATFPEQHHFFFFVLKNTKTGQHAFSETATEHQQAKTRYHQGNDINFS